MPELIAQIRNNLLFERRDEYNCSATPIDWSTRGTPTPIFGSLCILVCLLGIIPYVACMRILWELRKQACYKMMFCLGMLDLGVLVGNIFVGVIFIIGGMFCHSPKIFVAVTFLADGCFVSSCCACLMIALNRFVELFNIRPLLKIYQGGRAWVIMMIPVAYGMVFNLCTPFTLPNSEMHLLMFDPMIHDGKYDFTSYFLIMNNFASPCISTSLYMAMLYKIVTKWGTMVANRAAIMISIQCGIIVVVHATTCLGYVFLQYYPFELLCYAMQLIWISMHALPPYIYFAFNPSVRKGLLPTNLATPNPSMFTASTAGIITGSTASSNSIAPADRFTVM